MSQMVFPLSISVYLPLFLYTAISPGYGWLRNSIKLYPRLYRKGCSSFRCVDSYLARYKEWHCMIYVAQPISKKNAAPITFTTGGAARFQLCMVCCAWFRNVCFQWAAAKIHRFRKLEAFIEH